VELLVKRKHVGTHSITSPAKGTHTHTRILHIHTYTYIHVHTRSLTHTHSLSLSHINHILYHRCLQERHLQTHTHTHTWRKPRHTHAHSRTHMRALTHRYHIPVLRLTGHFDGICSRTQVCRDSAPDQWQERSKVCPQSSRERLETGHRGNERSVVKRQRRVAVR
jgi:hypothetical protein